VTAGGIRPWPLAADVPTVTGRGAAGVDVCVYFNNDHQGFDVANAKRLLEPVPRSYGCVTFTIDD
jgi:uncharacterized protein YecE (DUF72 family)